MSGLIFTRQTLTSGYWLQRGRAFYIFGPGMEDRLEPFHISWGWHTTAKYLDEPDEFGSTPRIRRLEFEGTHGDCCPWMSVPEAIDFQAALGPEAIHQRMRELAAHSPSVVRLVVTGNSAGVERCFDRV
jgi:isopenicillin-N epimerase